jgi:DNA mismatch repair protein PMS2
VFKQDMGAGEEAERELRTVLHKEDFAQMRVCGQFNLGFIIARLRDHLFIVDQHASDEKYRFETLQRTTKMTTQPLITCGPISCANAC